MWSSNGRELFYQGMDGRIITAAYTSKGDSFVPEKPRTWSEKRVVLDGIGNFDIAPTGNRVAALFESEGRKPDTSLHILLNVTDELRRRAVLK